MSAKRTIKTEIEFDDKGTFQAYWSAQNWCNENGYSHGSSDRTGPIAMWKGDFSISKWHNLSKKEQSECDGIITGNHREGPVKITLYN